MKIVNLLETQQTRDSDENERFAEDIKAGLSSTPKSIPTKYFYDETGSILFQKITGHADYYLTQAEFNILDSIKHELAKIIDSDEIDIIELGAGDGHKTELIIQGFIESGKKVNFYPIDISEKAMQQLEEGLQKHDALSIHGIIAEYFSGLSYVRQHSNNHQLVLFLGSNIGNFSKTQSKEFLLHIRDILSDGDYALIGFDLKKDIPTLVKAYNDSAGYTSDFNLNLLTRINRELGGEFMLEHFQHYGNYNPVLGAMESFLISRKEQDVYIANIDQTVHFDAFEPIHLEYSFKYLKTDIDDLCYYTGFHPIKHFTDDHERFVDSLWQIKSGGND